MTSKVFRGSVVIVLWLIVGFITSCFTPNTSLQWEHLGTRTVQYGLDRDVIKVTASEGTYRKLKIKVTGGSLNMHRLIVQYGNGSKDVIPVKQNFSKGSASRIIDLKGNKRVIRDITFFYDTKNRSEQRAIVHVYGRR